MLKRALLLVFCFFALSTSVVFAQGTGTPATDANGDGDVDNKFGYKISMDEYAQYSQAIETCDTPSLECLVHYTTRFAAMEWALDIAQGKIGPLDSDGTNPDGTPIINDTGRGGVFAAVMNLTGHMYNNPPAHTATYVADVIDTTGFAQPAYAQGLGFASLDPILNLWKVFRNIAYFFFIIIFVVIGFMIMLRKRISGQAAVTAQQAIPSVIVSLILVTFSYAIAGFMVDLMYVLMFLIIGLFNGISFNMPNGTALTGENILNFSLLHLIGFLFTANVNQEAVGANMSLVSSILESARGTETFVTQVGGFAGGLTLSLVIAVAVLIGAVRLFFELLKSYAAIILYIVASPLILMFGAIPGKDVFWPWLKGIIGNLLAFPAVLLMLIIYIEFTARGASDLTVTGGSEGGFMPPFLMGNGTAGNMVGPLLGLAIILGLPDIIKEIKKAAGAGEGGIGSMLAGFAWNGLQKGWSGDKNVPMSGLINGKNLTTAAAMGVAAPVGGLAYGTISALRGKGFRQGFNRGAAAGAIAPVVLPRTAGLISGAFSTLGTQSGQAVGEYLIGDGIARLKHRVTNQKAKNLDTGMGKYEEAQNTSNASVDNTQAPDVNNTNTPY